MSENIQDRIQHAYDRIRAIYRKKGLLQSFYTSFRLLTCPFKQIFSLIPEGGHYIDVGCGFGFISLWTALVFPQARVTGMDVVESRIRLARQLTTEAGTRNLDFLVKDITREPVDNAEIILLIDLFHHIPFEHQLSFLGQCIDKAPKGGYIVFKDIDRRPWWKFRVNYIQDFLFTRRRTYSRHKDEYLAFFASRGCEAEYFDLKKGYAYAHYLIRARKT